MLTQRGEYRDRSSLRLRGSAAANIQGAGEGERLPMFVVSTTGRALGVLHERRGTPGLRAGCDVDLPAWTTRTGVPQLQGLRTHDTLGQRGPDATSNGRKRPAAAARGACSSARRPGQWTSIDLSRSASIRLRREPAGLRDCAVSSRGLWMKPNRRGPPTHAQRGAISQLLSWSPGWQHSVSLSHG